MAISSPFLASEGSCRDSLSGDSPREPGHGVATISSPPELVLYAMAGACLLGLVVTAAFRIEPRGRALDEVSLAAPRLPAERLAPA